MSSWTKDRLNPLLLALPRHDQSLLPVPKRASWIRSGACAARPLIKKAADRSQNLKVVSEFRQKLRIAEDLISKLGFSMREIQTSRRRPKETPQRGLKSSLLPFKQD